MVWLVVLTVPCVLHAAMPRPGPLTCLTPKGGRMPAFFPDGKRIAYVWPSPDGSQHLHLLDLTTRTTQRVGEMDGVERPTVSPDGKWIAYQSGPIFARKIWIVDPTGGAPRLVTRRPGFHTRPCWIDSGKRLAFASGTGRAQTVVSIDPFMSEAKVQTYKHLAGGRPTFSTSGKLAALVSTGENNIASLRVLRANGTVHTELPQRDSTVVGVNPRGCYDPVFSPDEQYLVYVRAGLQPLSDIYLRDLTSGEQTPLTTDHADNQSPAFSPDGRSLAFVATRTGSAHMVFLMPLK